MIIIYKKNKFKVTKKLRVNKDFLEVIALSKLKISFIFRVWHDNGLVEFLKKAL